MSTNGRPARMRNHFRPETLRLAAAVFAVTGLSCSDGNTTEPVKVSTVEVSGPSEPMIVGQTAQFAAIPKDNRGNALGDRSVSGWSSSNPTSARVDENGLVTAILGGATEISATIEGVTGSTPVDIHNPVPTVDRTEPSSVPLGDPSPELRVIGRDFLDGAHVLWNDRTRPSTFVSDKEMRVTLISTDAQAAGENTISVLNPSPGGGTSTRLTINVENPAPAIASIAPTSATAGSPGFTLAVTGTGFVVESRVQFDRWEATTTYVSSELLHASIPAAAIAEPGYKAVSVTSPAPGGGVTSTAEFASRIDVTDLPRIAAGPSSTCAVTEDGEVFCWGRNDDRQLGDASTTARLTPHAVAIPPDRRMITVSSGFWHSCGLDETGQAWCWGRSETGELARPDRGTFDPAPVQAPWPFAQISVGRSSCAVLTDGAGVCWGSNHRGALGRGVGGGSSFEPRGIAFGYRYREIGVGNFFACGLLTTGRIVCWGANDSGQLGDGTTNDAFLPVGVQSAATFTSLSVGWQHACAIDTARQLHCWGLGADGRLGDGTTISRSVPVAVAGIGSVAFVSAGMNTTCAVDTGGAAHCWGRSDTGQTGTGALTMQTTPQSVPNLGSATQVAVGEGHACALLSSRDVYCWGLKAFGQVGTGERGIAATPAMVTGGLSAVTSIATGGFGNGAFTCSTTISGPAYCWGSGAGGQLGTGISEFTHTPRAIPGYNFTTIDSGVDHACGLDPAGRAYCWGLGSTGQLGTGFSQNTLTPLPVTGQWTFTSISTGSYHTCGITDNLRLYCWGYNPYGQIGHSSAGLLVLSPALVLLPTVRFVSVTAGQAHTCALTDTSRVYCWGNNVHGELGSGNTTNQSTPVEVVGLNDVRTVSAGGYHTCATTNSGTGYCWGWNATGELGVGPSGISSSTTPVAVAGSHSFRTITAGNGVTCGVTTAETGLCWGHAAYGQTGTGSQVFSESEPSPVSGSLRFTTIEPAERHTCAVATNGAPYCWGLIGLGALGTGEFGVQFTPARVAGGIRF